MSPYHASLGKGRQAWSQAVIYVTAQPHHVGISHLPLKSIRLEGTSSGLQLKVLLQARPAQGFVQLNSELFARMYISKHPWGSAPVSDHTPS